VLAIKYAYDADLVRSFSTYLASHFLALVTLVAVASAVVLMGVGAAQG